MRYEPDPPNATCLHQGAAYDRHRDLPRLLPLTAGQLSNAILADRHQVVLLLLRALRKERQRAVTGAWAYDLARHRLLLDALRHETAHPAERALDQP